MQAVLLYHGWGTQAFPGTRCSWTREGGRRDFQGQDAVNAWMRVSRECVLFNQETGGTDISEDFQGQDAVKLRMGSTGISRNRMLLNHGWRFRDFKGTRVRCHIDFHRLSVVQPGMAGARRYFQGQATPELRMEGTGILKDRVLNQRWVGHRNYKGWCAAKTIYEEHIDFQEEGVAEPETIIAKMVTL